MKVSHSAGRGRLLRLLQKLRVTETPAHQRLLLAATERSPSLAIAYLGACPLRLEPAQSMRWLAGTAVIGRVVEHAAAGPNLFLDFALRWASKHIKFMLT
jgi:hypothetical protein